jgi:uncharacterized protein
MTAIEEERSWRRTAPARITHIDSLRGLALMGVIVMNIGAMVMMINGRQVFASATAFDIAVAAADVVLMLGKARSCFAFLFGAGFAMLMLRAEARGAPFRRSYAKRLTILLAFGLINQIFLFWGDILVTYALLGFALMFLHSWSNARLLKVGLALVTAPPLLAGIAQAVLGQPLPNLIEFDRAAETARALAAYTSTSYVDAIVQNIWIGATQHAAETAHMAVYDLSVFGLFLLGAWAVRTGLLTEPLRHRALLRRIVCWCLPLGLALSVPAAAPYLGIRVEGRAGGAIAAAFVGAPVLALGYLALFALLFAKRAGPAQWILAPAGRMSLTNYLISGAFGGWVFYGYGLGRMGDFGLVELTLFGLGLFLALALLSRLWLSLFACGPAEWLWRRLSYGPTPIRAARAAHQAIETQTLKENTAQ